MARPSTATRRKARRGSAPAGGARRPLLTPEQWRDLSAIALATLALFLLLAFLPVERLGERGPEWFPEGNALGSFGAFVRALLMRAAGPASVLVAALLLIAALREAAWLSPGWTARLARRRACKWTTRPGWRC